MALENWRVEITTRREVTAFIEQWHYSKSINGCIADFCYKLVNPEGEMCGAMFFGRLAMANQYKRFVTNEADVIELRRLCCIDDTPKNAESFFIARAIKLLKKQWLGKLIISYADKEHAHSGVIYRASNFTMIGEIKGAKVILFEGKQYHDKAIRTKYKGELKPFAQKLVAALSTGTAHYKQTAGKYTYTYKIR